MDTINKCDNDMKYTIKDLKRDFGPDNIIEEKAGNILCASVDVVLKDNTVNVLKELEKIGLILLGANKIECDHHLFLLNEYPGCNVANIVEYNDPGNFKIVIQQSTSSITKNTIVCYTSNRGNHYRLNHLDK